jgi:glyoxylase-like metal-dependent hydrolase (beta-lactamase superfamily II)
MLKYRYGNLKIINEEVDQNMKIAEGLEMLEIQGSMFGTPGIFYPTLVWDNEEVVLIDTGVPGQSELIAEAVEKAGVPFDSISKILITHQDIDHIGNLSTIINKATEKIEVFSHKAEKPYIQGELTPIKMTPERMKQQEVMLSKLPVEKRDEIKKMFSNLSTKVDKTVEDDEELPFCGGIQVIHTPGHTPGHICLYLKKYKTLVAGDEMNIVEGKLLGPNPQFTYNMEEALNSLKKLSKYEINTVICYHGGIYSNNVNQRIDELCSTT